MTPKRPNIMKILLNPKYESLRAYMMHLEEHFNKEGREIHSGRNVIRTLDVDGITLCIKRYAPPTFRRQIQQLIYKSSKAKLAYTRPWLLRERGFESPESVAFVRYRHGLWRTTTYFVCLQSTYRYRMDGIQDAATDEEREVLRHFARYAAHLHEDGFLHRDFSSSNILYDKINGRYHFSLIDTNSMKCGKAVSIEQGCRNLAKLSGSDAFFAYLTACYAEERKADAGHCAKLIQAARAERAAK